MAKVKAKITVRDLGWDRIKKGLSQLDDVVVEVGFFDEDNALKAAVNEFGTDDERIPPRPFMSSTLDAFSPEYFRELGRGLGMVVDGKTTEERVMLRLGQMVRTDIIDAIIAGPWQPNADSTAEAKGSDNPLVDTGEMQRALDVRVKKGEG